jgi:hypothetical protein
VAVRRKYLLTDSVDAIMSLGRDDLRKRWRFEFLGEPGIDSGGVTREWFQLVTEQIMDPAFGLWKSSVNNQACVTINPSSGTYLPILFIIDLQYCVLSRHSVIIHLLTIIQHPTIVAFYRHFMPRRSSRVF